MDLEAMKKRCEAATPGPWHIVGHPWNPDADYAVAGHPDPHIGKKVIQAEEQDWEEDLTDEEHYANFLFCVEARTDIPALIKEVERLREDNTTSLDARRLLVYENEQLQEENQRLREALELYADPLNYEYGETWQAGKLIDSGPSILRDRGQKARTALGRVE